MVNFSDEDNRNGNRNSLFAQVSTKSGVSAAFINEQTLPLLTALIEKVSRAAAVNPNFEPTKLGLTALTECLSTVNGVLQNHTAELGTHAVESDTITSRSLYNP